MNQAEAITAEKIGRIMRAVRKQNGLNQTALASQLEISQGALSKYESATNIPSAHCWMEFCTQMHIPTTSYVDGFIDHQHPIAVSNVQSVGSFKLPKRYSYHCGSTARAASPFLFLFKQHLGEEKLDEYFDHVDFDRDYFVNLSNPLNVNFALDIARVMIEKGFLKPDTVSALVRSVPQKSFHGQIYQAYESIRESTVLLEMLMSKVSLYDCNTIYALDEVKANRAVLSISPSDHLKEFDYRPDSMGDFVCQYKKNWFLNFLGFSAEKPAIEELECHFKGGDKCLYQIHLH